MKPISDLADKHPVTTGIIGTVSGLFSWVGAHLEQVQNFASTVGALFGAATAVVTFALVIRQWRAKRRRA